MTQQVYIVNTFEEIPYSVSNNSNGYISLFLAGPTHRVNNDDLYLITYNTQSWRSQAIQYIKQKAPLYTNKDVVIFSPEYRDISACTNNKNDNYIKQVQWEINNLTKATIIIFWVARQFPHLPALTTNVELGEYLHSNKIVVGSPADSPNNNYLKTRIQLLNNITWHNNMSLLIEDALIKATNKSSKENNIFFTSDTHFSSQRTLQLSRRPFISTQQMDETLINNWNKTITNNDVVYHLGDIANDAASAVNAVKQLNFKQLIIMAGNYDVDEVKQALLQIDNRDIKFLSQHKYIAQTISIVYNGETHLFNISHYPSAVIALSDKCNDNAFNLYGHIHKLQMVKRKSLNVSTDCHDFCPIDIDTVLFYKNAIINHYDEEVFI